MNTPQLDHHGGHVKPHYKPQPGQSEGQAGVSADETRQDGEVSGIFKRFSKHVSAGDTPIAMGWIKGSYAEAIEYTGSPQGLRGMLLLWGLIGTGLVLWPTVISFSATSWEYRNVFDIPLWIAPFLFFGFCLFLPFWTARLELFRPEDEPTLFDRQHRKVYRVFRETQPGWRGLFKPWPLRATEYDWDLIDVEHQAVLTTTGSTVTRYHALVFLVKKSASDPTIIDSFTIGNAMELGELTVPAVWEHIRRFMEEHGPHLPPGETLAPSQPPQGFGQSLAAVGPFGSSYRPWWRDNAAFMILIHVLFPVFVPFFLLWGFFNWLSYRTATRIEWPAEVRAAVGLSAQKG
jgi:hypothetical protein